MSDEQDAQGPRSRAEEAGPRVRRGGKKYAETAGTWVPLVASLTVLVISVYSFIAVRSAPGITVVMPDMIRLAVDSKGTYSKILMQPVIAVLGETQRAETVTGLAMQMRREGAAKSPGGQADFL